jgi:excisionase family DNA binding protein
MFLNPTQAAKYLGVGRRTIYYWMEKKQLPYSLTPSGRRLIKLTDLTSYSWEKKDNAGIQADDT